MLNIVKMNNDFIEYIKKEFLFDDFEIEKFKEFLNKPLKKTIRINTKKISVDKFKDKALKNNWILKNTNLGKNTFYIDRENIKKLALGNTFEHIAGYFYIQELSASSSPFYMSGDIIDNGDYLILDMSASPGGKTTQLSEYYPNSLIVANDFDKSRLKGLFSNIDRMGALNVVVTNYDGRFFKQIPELFDKILLDAPCSGEGTSFKTDDALKYWNLKNIKTIAKLQFGLLEAAIKSCKVGGEIVYSTCTLNKIENEGVIKKALKKYGNFIQILPLGEREFKRNWPHLDFSGGFFVAKIKKIKSLFEDSKYKKEIKYVRQNIEKLNSTDKRKIETFFKENFDFDISKYGIFSYKGEIQIINKSLEYIWDKLFLYKIGINIGTLKAQDFIPNFYSGTFTKFLKNIIYFSKEEIIKLFSGYEIDIDKKDGYYQIIFNDLELGLIKVKNNKAKSLIPTKLMIKK